MEISEDGGVDVVSLANNHILDYGVPAMESTQEILDEAGIVHVGVGHVLVLLHHGWENTSQVNDPQRTNVTAAFDAGATVVIGHHPHVLQGVEHGEDGTFVAYSLGNFVFDSSPGRTRSRSSST